MMKRLRIGVALGAIGLIVSAAWVYGGGIDDIDHPNFNGVFLLDRTGSHRAAISSTGELSVRVSHASSVLHVAGLATAGAVKTEAHLSGAMRTWQVNACGFTASHVVASNANRRDLILSNLGGAAANAQHVVLYIGYGGTGHVAVSAHTGYVLGVHRVVFGDATAPTAIATTPPLILTNYQGPIACITDLSTAILGVVEILK